MKHLIIILTLLLGVSGVSARTRVAEDTLTIREAFINLPLDVVEILSRSSRLDMLDYLRNGEMRPVRNSMNGTSVVVAPATDSLLNVEVTGSSRISLRLLRKGKRTIAACISTLGDSQQACDSEISFYGEGMKPLKSKSLFPDLKIEDFLDFGPLTSLSPSERKGLLALIPFPTFELAFDGDSSLITARLTVGTFMGQEDYDRLKPYIRDRRLYWTGSRYRLQ